METKLIEATNIDHGGMNWGKFMLGRFTPEEWAHRSTISVGRPLLSACGWGHNVNQLLVLDLQTGEGAVFRIGGLASSDLNKHRVWVCPMFEPFLAWLYKQETADLQALPSLVALDDPGEWRGYRREGPDGEPEDTPVPPAAAT